MFTVNRLKSDGDQKISRNLNMIKLFYQNKDYATAKNYVTDLLNLKPDSSEAYKLLSQINEALGEHEQAMKNYKKSLELKVYSDQNNSLDSSYQFTPTKVSSPVISKSNNHSITNSHAQESHLNQASIDNVEKLIEKKMTVFEKSFESINQHLVQLNENFNKNYEEVSSFKKKLLDMQRKLALLTAKQDELFNKLPLLLSKNEDIKEQLSSFSINFNNLSEDNCKIMDELYNLKDTVKMLCDKSNLSDYDEESYNDYENEDEEHTNRPLNLGGQQLNLNELFKPSKDDWKCSTCETPNALSDSACVCCETPNPNVSSKPQINGFGMEKNSSSPFKFGVPSAPTFGFGPQAPQIGSSAFPSFGNTNSSANLSGTNSVQVTSPAKSFSFGNVTSPSVTSLNQKTSPSTVSTTAITFSSFGNVDTSSTSNAKTTVSTTTSSAFPSFSNSAYVNPKAASSNPTNVTSSFSFTGQLNSLTNEGTQKPLALNVTNSNGFSLANILTNSSTSTIPTNFSSINFNSRTNSNVNPTSTTTATSSIIFPISSTSNFSFNPTSNSNVVSATSTTTSSSVLSFPTSNINSFSINTQSNSNVINSTSISTISSGLSFSTSNTSNFAFNTSSNSKSIFSNTPTKPITTNFSFENINFSSNLFGQPSLANNGLKNNSVSKNEADENEEPNHLENGGDTSQDGDYFKLPDVKLPEKYEQVTGEENETAVFEKRSKLFIFKDSEYKERGVGVLKILRHNTTLKYRILMRRDHIFKVCLNTYLRDMVNLEIVDEKFVRFSCIDFSEDKPASGVFLAKFGNAGTLTQFKELVESLRDSSTNNQSVIETNQNTNVIPNNGDLEVELVYTKEPKPEHLEIISKLHLPINFYDYEDKALCKGCIGCKDETLSWNDLTQSASDKTDSSQLDLGLFSSIATDLNLAQNKIDSIAAASENLENEHANDQNFVSEKSKLLPQNFEIKTGEEDEEIVFNERAKMYHYINDEWKERGVGNMKILKQKETNNYRLLMRRERIHNVICNHKISEHVKLEPFQNSSNTLTWFSKDFSEESSGIDEVFALKFKNETLMKQFEDKVNECIRKSSA